MIMFVGIITIIFIFLLFFQTTFLHITLLAGGLVALFALFPNRWILFIAFILGLIDDILSFQTVGVSSLFFVCLVGLMLLYARKFEVESLPFVGVFSVTASFVSTILFGGNFFFNTFFIVTTGFALFFFCLFLKNTFVKKQLRLL